MTKLNRASNGVGRQSCAGLPDADPDKLAGLAPAVRNFVLPPGVVFGLATDPGPS